MKKLMSLALLVLAGAALFTSCKKDETVPAPEITVTNNKVEYNITATADTTITFNVTVKAEGEIDQFTIKKIVGSTETSYGNPTGFAGKTDYVYNFQETFTPAMTYPISFKFKVVDKEGQEASITVTVKKITTGGQGTPFGQFQTYTVTLGAQNHTTGSSFASSNGNVYTLSQAAQNSALIDFMYYYGATNLATLAAPGDAQTSAVYSAVSNWQTKNNTKFVKNPTINFDNLSATTDISGVTFGSDTKANQLAANNIIAFKTDAGKIGFIKVNSITGTNDGTINITVKVQQ
ncbi:MAG: hypothetical protein N2449_10415 [Bacteroidales bacterium]|nr:hypothetical protein [Bacteroidales bacterium]